MKISNEFKDFVKAYKFEIMFVFNKECNKFNRFYIDENLENNLKNIYFEKKPDKVFVILTSFRGSLLINFESLFRLISDDKYKEVCDIHDDLIFIKKLLNIELEILIQNSDGNPLGVY